MTTYISKREGLTIILTLMLRIVILHESVITIRKILRHMGNQVLRQDCVDVKLFPHYAPENRHLGGTSPHVDFYGVFCFWLHSSCLAHSSEALKQTFPWRSSQIDDSSVNMTFLKSSLEPWQLCANCSLSSLFLSRTNWQYFTPDFIQPSFLRTLLMVDTEKSIPNWL